MEKEISEGNRLIVEFMGGKFVEKYRQDGHDYDIFDLPASFPIKLSDPDIFGMKRTGYLGFHCQWDWLMPVVEKINNMQLGDQWFRALIGPTQCTINVYAHGGMSVPMRDPEFHVGAKDKMIEAVWETVILFIKWYNKTQNK